MIRLNTFTRLRIVHLLLGMMFFYGIEQIFLDSILHNASARGFVTIAYVVAVLCFDIPAGIVADRFSRKACVLAACAAQALSVLILGISSTLPLYIIGSLLFGLAIGLCDGAIQALLYDRLSDEQRTKDYAREQGRNNAAFLIGAGVANVVSGIMAQHMGIRIPYFLSAIPCIVAFLLTLGVIESQRHHEAQADNWLKHLHGVAHEIRQHRKILVFGAQFVAAEILILTVGEFGQIYMLSFGISTVTLGLLWAVDAGFAAGGRITAEYFQKYPRLFVITYCVILGLFICIHHRIGIGIFWLVYGLNEALQNISETEVQHETASHVRATTLSIIGFAGNMLAIPIIYLYNKYYVAHGIQAANRMIIIPAIIILLLTLLVRLSSSKHDNPASTDGIRSLAIIKP